MNTEKAQVVWIGKKKYCKEKTVKAESPVGYYLFQYVGIVTFS